MPTGNNPFFIPQRQDATRRNFVKPSLVSNAQSERDVFVENLLTDFKNLQDLPEETLQGFFGKIVDTGLNEREGFGKVQSEIENRRQQEYDRLRGYLGELGTQRAHGRDASPYYWDRELNNNNFLYFTDKRKIHPVTGKPINPNKDLKSGRYSRELISDISKTAGKFAVDPYLAIAIGLQETNLGKTDYNIGHTLNQDDSMRPDMQVPNMVSAIKRKMDEAKKYYKNYSFKDENDELERLIQFYNGVGKLSPQTEKDYHQMLGKGTNKFYGIDVSEEPLDLMENPAYGKTIRSLMEVLKNDPEIREYAEPYTMEYMLKREKELLNSF